ncbi:hypothetical protein ACJ6TS_09440 [Citrobacter telavivensis]
MATRLGISFTVLVFLQTHFGGLSEFEQRFAHAPTDEEMKSINSPQWLPRFHATSPVTCANISSQLTALSGVQKSVCCWLVVIWILWHCSCVITIGLKATAKC